MNLPKAKEPFRFFSRLSLTIMTGLKAASVQELLSGIQSCPGSSLYAHTHHFLREHGHGTPDAANDFSLWASESLQDDVLAERLMALDVAAHQTVEDLRAALVRILTAHLSERPDCADRQAPPGKEFRFLRAARFSLPTGKTAGDLSEFCSALREVSLSSLYLHAFESRLRPPLGVDDFSLWFERDLGEKELGQDMARLDPTRQTLEEIRTEILRFVSARMEAIKRA